MQATFAATLFDEWCRLGLREVVICPGSRSSPLVMAAASRGDLQLHVRLDERSAGFFALGRSLATASPVAIVVTSGTAAAELHAVVAEADLAGVALVVITADRPPELQGVGAPQTINQRHLYGSMVRRFEEPGVARHEAARSWRPLASNLWHDALGARGQRGPVHLNAAFAEPLVGTATTLPEGRAASEPWQTRVETTAMASFNISGRRVLAVVGAGTSATVISRCRSLNWVVVGDATANGTLAYFDALLRSDTFAKNAEPDVVIRLGGLPASKVLGACLRAWQMPVVAFRGAGPVADPDGLVSATFDGLPDSTSVLMGDGDYVAWWRSASDRVDAWLSTSDADSQVFSEPRVARTVVRWCNERRVPLVVGSSMPVRDVEWWTPARTSVTFANRGVNGIDGVVSTVLGVAAGQTAVGLVGDITMLHDVSALVDGLGDAGGSCALVVVDNGGGGIFSFLPQQNALDAASFDRLFATPKRHDLVNVARAFGHDAERVTSSSELDQALARALAQSGLSVIVVSVPSREENVHIHERLNERVRELIEVPN